MQELHLTLFGKIVILLSVFGAGTLIAWTLSLIDRFLDQFLPKVKDTLRRWSAHRALTHVLNATHPLTEAEREAMRQGAEEAMEAFRRAQVAVTQARR